MKITVDKSQIEGILNQLSTVGEIIDQLTKATQNNAEFQVFGKYAAIVFGNTIDVLVASGELVQNLSDLCRLSNELYGYVVTKATTMSQEGKPVEINIFNLKSSLHVPLVTLEQHKAG